MRRFLRSATLGLAAAATLFTAACENPVPPSSLPEPDPATATYAPSLNIDISQFTRTASGLYYRDQQVGSGARAVAQGDSVVLHYTLYRHRDGEKLESSRDRNTPLRAVASPQNLIAGFAEGLVGMRVGGTRVLIIRPSLGYGPLGNGQITGQDIIIFVVELLDVSPPPTQS